MTPLEATPAARQSCNMRKTPNRIPSSSSSGTRSWPRSSSAFRPYFWSTGWTRHSEAVFPRLPVRRGATASSTSGAASATRRSSWRAWSPRGRRCGASTVRRLPRRGGKWTATPPSSTTSPHARRCRGGASERRIRPRVRTFRKRCSSRTPSPACATCAARCGLGGRMVHIVWRERADNPWLSMARGHRAGIRSCPPAEDARTCGPGPFSMSD